MSYTIIKELMVFIKEGYPTEPLPRRQGFWEYRIGYAVGAFLARDVFDVFVVLRLVVFFAAGFLAAGAGFAAGAGSAAGVASTAGAVSVVGVASGAGAVSGAGVGSTIFGAGSGSFTGASAGKPSTRRYKSVYALAD